MLLRIISAAVLVPAALAVVLYAPPIFYTVAVGLVGTACIYEYFQLIRKMGLHAQPWLGHIGFWTLYLGMCQRWYPPTIAVEAILIGAFLVSMSRKEALRDRAFGLMANLLGVFYIGFFLYPAVPLRFDFGDRTGLHWILILLIVTWAGDTAALLVGKKFGRHPFAATISPKKTQEGAAGGLLAGTGCALLFRSFLFPELPLIHVLVVSLLVGVFGQLGDLAESMLKRAAGVKDSSQLIPGHGGVLDRIDSLLFSIPVLYLYLVTLYRN